MRNRDRIPLWRLAVIGATRGHRVAARVVVTTWLYAFIRWLFGMTMCGLILLGLAVIVWLSLPYKFPNEYKRNEFGMPEKITVQEKPESAATEGRRQREILERCGPFRPPDTCDRRGESLGDQAVALDRAYKEQYERCVADPVTEQERMTTFQREAQSQRWRVREQEAQRKRDEQIRRQEFERRVERGDVQWGIR